jgi:hypothetical protein
LGDYTDNRAKGLRCVHPIVTLIEKLDAIVFRFERKDEPEVFIRHYEDAAAIIVNEGKLPGLQSTIKDLAAKIDFRGDGVPSASDPAFAHSVAIDPEFTRAYEAIQPMFWAPRIGFNEACRQIRDWLARNLP